MPRQTFTRNAHLPVSREEAFHWHERPGAFERMLPPWLSLKSIETSGTIRNNDTTKVTIQFGLFNLTYQAKFQNYVSGLQFQDVQIKGPFSFWQHTHIFEEINDKKSKLTDYIEYELPAPRPSRFLINKFSASFIEEKLDKLFTYRYRTLQNDLFLHSKYSQKKLKILVTGSSGLIGHDLVSFLRSGGHTVLRFNRHELNLQEEKFENPALFENLDAVVNLAGENIGAQRWTEKRKNELVASRVYFIKALCSALKKLNSLPKTFITASGIGIFGDRDFDDILVEESKPGEGFLAHLASQVEKSCQAAAGTDMRVVCLRLGPVISFAGGILKKMYTPYSLFLGGAVGTGRQMISWLSITDALGLILFALTNEKISGPVNAVAPNPVSNAKFSEVLANTLDRPHRLRIPEFAVESLFGEMGKELLLYGQNVRPAKALRHGYEFLHTELHDALSYCLGK